MDTHLTREEEQRLFEEYRRTGDKKIETRLVESQLGLVGRLAQVYLLKGIDPHDLFQEGAIGLLEAVRRFDPSRGTRLSTYASHWIRAYVFRYTLANYRLVRLGTTERQRRVFYRISALRARLVAAGLEPTPARLAGLLGVDAQTVSETEARMDARDLSLDAPEHTDSDRTGLSRLATSERPADDAIAEQEIAAILRFERDRYRGSLSGRQRELFDARWLQESPPTLKTMGDRLGISRERARQIERKMLNELGTRVRAKVAA
jgi:RNA polymerase sigma-32 factor